VTGALRIRNPTPMAHGSRVPLRRRSAAVHTIGGDVSLTVGVLAPSTMSRQSMTEITHILVELPRRSQREAPVQRWKRRSRVHSSGGDRGVGDINLPGSQTALRASGVGRDL